MRIDLAIKRRCVEMSNSGVTSKRIYDDYFRNVHEGMNYNTFKHKLILWKKKSMADDTTLAAGTYAGFSAHAATVQVDANGNITQAWIKQTLDDGQWEELLQAIREHTKPIKCEDAKQRTESDGRMLEIPLYDMHFPLSEHKQTLFELMEIIQDKRWEEINIIIGQDLFHNDDFRGRTASGRQIERVDIAQAWRMARDFWAVIIQLSVENADRVKITYSKGNHDESLAWAFVQMLRVMFPQVIVDDSMKMRKAIYWNGCFIGITHGNGAKAKNSDLRGQFTIEFPAEFAAAKVREVHAGHLHHEKEGDLYGVMIRRLSRNGETDEWSDDEGFVGAHKRFMVFEWAKDRLKAIYYI